jgi:ATP-dependent RNA helicase RhlE
MPYKSNTYSSRFSGRNNSGRTSYSSSGRSNNNKRQGRKKDYIDPSRFVKTATPIEEQPYVAQNTFNDLKVNLLIKANLESMGITVPTAIQDEAIPHALAGRDIIGLADTGSGKTAAFAIPLLQSIMTTQNKALVIAPTRELAQQVEAAFRTMGKGSNLRGAVLIGGAGIGPQLRDLRAKPQIVIGTPGRIKDHLERGSLNLNDFKFLVVDEVDRMLDMGFIADVRGILQQLPSERQSFFFSATLDGKVQSLIETFAQDPVTVSVKTGTTGQNIHQDVVRVSSESQKMDKLHDLLIKEEVSKAIIFDDTQRGVERLSNELTARGFSADAIHGGKNQSQRQRSLKRFTQSEVTILVATDVAARGIDVSDITHVINYSQPQTYADYIHRIGRTGRAGRIGHALTFVQTNG